MAEEATPTTDTTGTGEGNEQPSTPATPPQSQPDKPATPAPPAPAEQGNPEPPKQPDQIQQGITPGVVQGLGAEEVQARVDEATQPLQAQLQEAQVELEAYKAAGAAGLDPQVLLNQVTFVNRLKGLDPAGEDFVKDLDAAIEAEKKENILFTDTPIPRRSSSPLNQHRGADGKGTGGKSPAELAAEVNKLNPY